MNRRIASFCIDPLLIQEALNIPQGHDIVGARWEFGPRNTLRIYITGPDLPEVPEGKYTPSIDPSITVTIDDQGKRVHTWNWNI